MARDTLVASVLMFHSLLPPKILAFRSIHFFWVSMGGPVITSCRGLAMYIWLGRIFCQRWLSFLVFWLIFFIEPFPGFFASESFYLGPKNQIE